MASMQESKMEKRGMGGEGKKEVRKLGRKKRQAEGRQGRKTQRRTRYKNDS